MTFKADQVENKLCGAQFSVSVDKGGSDIVMQTLGFLTFQPEIRIFPMT